MMQFEAQGGRQILNGTGPKGDRRPDGRGYREVVLGDSIVFRVDRRYSDLRIIGQGSYGVVCSALDQLTKTRVAIKRVCPVASSATDARRILREIKLMRCLGVHHNIVRLKDAFLNERHDELYIVMELLDSDLHRVIQWRQIFSEDHHKFFMYQLLRGVKYMHDYGVIHRDLKPGNLLIRRNCELCISDFGLARVKPTQEADGEERGMTEHVVTRWYRPPELMLSSNSQYTSAVDMWSVGCIFAEIIGRKVLFEGRDFIDQLRLIFDVIGSPAPEEVAYIRNPQARQFLDSVRGISKVPFDQLFPDVSSDAISLLEGLLVFDPRRRLTVEEALSHRYFDDVRAWAFKEDPAPCGRFDFSFEDQELTRLQLKRLIFEEVESIRSESLVEVRSFLRRRPDSTVVHSYSS